MVNKMVTKGDIITLSTKEFDEIIGAECKNRLGITLKEFLQKRKRGELSDATATQEIEMLLKVAYNK